MLKRQWQICMLKSKMRLRIFQMSLWLKMMKIMSKWKNKKKRYKVMNQRKLPVNNKRMVNKNKMNKLLRKKNYKKLKKKKLTNNKLSKRNKSWQNSRKNSI